MNTRPVIVAYSGVHQIFQIALAAEEAGLLDTFYGSIFDAPGKWGRSLGQIMGKQALFNRRCAGVPSKRLVEYPWPELFFRLKSRSDFVRQGGWIRAARWFDRHMAAVLSKKNCRLFVGVENCAAESFTVGRARGMKLVYDCPGFNPEISHEAAMQAAEEWKLPAPIPADDSAIKINKDRELMLADRVLVYSEVHQRSWELRGVPAQKFVRIPLWIDQGMWFGQSGSHQLNGPLRILYAGRISLMKGVPYLLQAVKRLGPSVLLNCVGVMQNELLPFVSPLPNVRIFDPVSKLQLRDIYWRHDVLVLPSLGDSFGFVALEAMACGLPVIVTENCGVPVPDPSWRMPIMSADAIVQRLEHYARKRGALHHDGELARQFARQFTPERYRERIMELLQNLLKS